MPPFLNGGGLQESGPLLKSSGTRGLVEHAMMATDTMLPFSVYATLPLWPLLGAIVVGVLLMRKRRPEPQPSAHGHGTDSGHGAADTPADLGGEGDHGHAHHETSTLGFAHWPVVLGVAIAALLAVVMFLDLPAALHRVSGVGGSAGQPATTAEAAAVRQSSASAAPHEIDPGIGYTVFHWISLGLEQSLARRQWIGLTFYFDALTAVMALVVCVVGLMVVLYSVGYMRDHHWHPERGYERFFAFLGLFVFSMMMLVYAGNFVLLYLGWELVGLCSYLLIGFYYKKPEAAAAAKKAFIVNRIGDFGFALGIFAIYYYLGMGHAGVSLAHGEGPFDYATVFKYADVLARTPSLWGWSAADVIGLLLLCGALGKSAQIPLYVWLPDAMEGPSPVSALIHAATMVTAGVYMVARCGPLFVGAPNTMEIIAILGAVGALFAATMAMAQYDMKRILAYSTMSQLAYMFVGLACAAPDAAIFHLYTHAFFKALLFLTAGNVMHAMGNIIDLREFSGLRRVLPTTYKLMGVGCLALAGLPFLSGFWSKDSIVHAAFTSEIGHGLPWLGWVLLLTAAMTAYYTFRMFFLCFHGPERFPKEAGDHPHEMPAKMLAPLYVLAIGAVFAGYLGVSWHTGASSFLGVFSFHGYFHHYLEASTIRPEHHEGHNWVMYASAAISIGAIALAYLRYGQAPQDEPDRKVLGPVWNLWNAKYYVDEIYNAVFVAPLRRLGQAMWATDNNFIDGIIWFVTLVPRALAAGLRFMQQGALQTYALVTVVGVAALLLLWQA